MPIVDELLQPMFSDEFDWDVWGDDGCPAERIIHVCWTCRLHLLIDEEYLPALSVWEK